MQHRTELTAPPWATDHRVEDGGVTWIRETTVDVTSSSETLQVRVYAMSMDEIKVEDGHVVIDRGGAPIVGLTGNDDEMSPADARRLAEAILSVVDAVESAR
jgi:hypothetical protein